MHRGSMIRTIRLGFKSLMLHKLRSALTMLGILFGVSSVIAMLSIGEGASYEAQERIKALGSNNIILESRKPPDQNTQQEQSAWTAQEYGLTYQDAELIADTLPAVKVVIPIREIPKRVRYSETIVPTIVLGTVPGYSEVTGVQLKEGRFLTRIDLQRKRNVAVIGSEIARKLFRLTNPIDKNIRIGKEIFRVIGQLAEPERGNTGKSADRMRQGIFVPLTAAISFFGELIVKTSAGSREMERVQLHRIKVQVLGNEEVLGTGAAIRKIMADQHKKKDFAVIVPLELLRQAEDTKRIFNIVLGSIAGISLLVGGIGIMNVMLATVTERTREIGIRRALGAKQRHIIAQFLVETVVLSCMGGILGILLGITIPAVVEWYSNITTIVSPTFPILAFGISAGVGILFGLYPAWRAAQMDPVEALRHE